MDSLLSWLLRYGELYLLAALVASGLVFVLVELAMEMADDHVGGISTVRLRVRQKVTPGLVLWALLRYGIPFAAAVFVFFSFLR